VSWTQLLAEKKVHRHKSSKPELANLRALVARDLADASLSALSADRRFATAYNAALQSATMAVACAGYRVSSTMGGHHKITFECAKLALGKPAESFADYLEICRRKRNNIDYDHSHVATDSEAAEILQKAMKFNELVEAWIASNHPALR
jgi:hypothetical protein